MVGLTEEASDLIKQTGANANEAVFGLLTDLCDLHSRQLLFIQLEKKQCGCDFERS